MKDDKIILRNSSENSVNAAENINSERTVNEPGFNPTAQLKPVEEEEDQLQMKKQPFQMKSVDEEEGEEIQMKKNPFQMKGEGEEEEELQMKKQPFQMKGGEEEEEEIQMKEGNSASDSAISESSTRTSLPENVQMKMESSLNADFSGVDIHSNSHKAEGMGAQAFAQGNEVHFAPGKYSPESQAGQELIGHELTHVVQQRQGAVAPGTQKKGHNINSEKHLEDQADIEGKRAAKGEKTNISSNTNKSNSSVVQREENQSSIEDEAAAFSSQLPFTGQITTSGGSLGRESTTDTTLFSEEIPLDASRPISPDNSEEVSMGRRTSTNANATINNQGHLGANFSTTTHNTHNGEVDANSRRSLSGGGFIDLGPNGEFQGGGGNLGAGVGRMTVNVGGAYHVSATQPTRIQDYYEVSWVRTYSGTAGGSMSGNHNTSAGLTLNGGQSVTGKRRFINLADAQSFYQSRDWVEIDPSNAAALGEGDIITESVSSGLTANASVSMDGITLGASINVGSNHTVQVTGIGNQHISVKVTDQSVLGAGGTLGVPGVSMGLAGQTTSTDGYIVEFDLSSEAGRNSFDYLREYGRLSGSGYQMRAKIDGTSDRRTTTIGLAGANMTMSNETSENITTHEDGRVVEERQGTESSGITVPLIGTFNESNSLTATDDSNAEDRTYQVRNTVSGSSTEDVNRELATSTGTATNRVTNELDNQDTRRWTVTSSFTHRQVSQLVRAVRAGRFNYHRLIYQAGHGRDFIESVIGAGDDWDSIDRAFTEFISETGDRGLELVRDTIDARPVFSLELQGDPYLRGESGHAALRNRIASYENSLANENSDAREIGLGINQEIRQQQIRLTAISDPERYPDLPNVLRHQEVSRSQNELHELENLRDRALSLGGRSPDTSYPALDEGELQTSEDAAACIEPLPNVADQIAALEIQGVEMRGQTVQAGNRARRDNWIHHGAHANPNIAYETWGETHWYGDDDHVSEYRDAHSFLNIGNSAWTNAQEAWTEFQQMKHDLLFDQGNEQAVLSKLLYAVNKFSFAKTAFSISSRHFDSIRSQHSDRATDQFFAYDRNYGLPDNLSIE